MSLPGMAAGRDATSGRPMAGRIKSMRSTRFSTRRSTLRNFAAVAAMALGATFGGNALAAGYPERPIELIVPWGPGGGADQLARLISKLMEPMLGQGIPVVNVPGGTGATGMAKLLAAPADGYSMAIYIADSHALLAGKSPRWTMNDITPVAVMIKGPSFLFVKEDSPFKTWDDFAKEAKANPNKLKVATLGSAASTISRSQCLTVAASRLSRCLSPNRASATFPSLAVTPMRSTSRQATLRSFSMGSRCARFCCSGKSGLPRSRMCQHHLSSDTR